ncbi:hypothetical protein GE21DRAFT_5676 [Neurospora crassa]|uniref:Uncharacterized protein n=1 Tax=Neurospora crassa (strain ATCC 24698 / 74-OR23-1A / CBS 708.71 / DSM 1257 / FGSC 987) TaxID=367110 RepID=Q7SEJ4_NEUCR|nr:hypothetical protein NCU09729 [Neurospora crassa OR74A]EAA35195.2 hypothetical protein NCU09729 [Neurospora crassa OR74A]KHE81459.1 hypothetical protein GE21DRAFT_5676 [Neurospora crassa]|eukprot:XP_964431.2 hypothetical protein NCU09729 [Neurospora crassa OR74A]
MLINDSRGMVMGKRKLPSLALLLGLGVDTVRGGYHVSRNVTVSSIPEAHSQSTTVGSGEANISPSSISAPPISIVLTEFNPSSMAPPRAVSTTFIIVSSPSLTDPSDGIGTSASTLDYSSRIDEEGSTITTAQLPSTSDFTSSSSPAWNYEPVEQKSESPGQNDAMPTVGAVPGGIVMIPPEIPPWMEQTASFWDDVSLGQPPVDIPTSWDYVSTTTTSDFTSTQTIHAPSTRGQFWNQTSAPYYNQPSTSITRASVFPNTTTTLSSSTISHCQPSDLTATVTSWEVVHTSTITWVGNPANYTQPYPTLIPPSVETVPPCIDLVTKTTPPPGITLSTCFTVTASGSGTRSCTLTVSTNSWGYGPQTSTTIRYAPTVTFITTDKNPAVLYSPIQTPNYGVTNDITKSPRPTAVSVDPVDPPAYNTFDSNNSPGEVTKPVPKPVTVVVKPTEVIIGSSTITDNAATKTYTVVVGGETFTVGPTQVIGGGATVTRPFTSKGGGARGAGAGDINYAPVPTSTKLNDLPIIVSSSVAVIGTGSSTFTLPLTPTAVVVEGHTISIGPSGIAIIDPKGNPIIATVTLPPPREQTITIHPGSNNNNNEPITTTVDGVSITIISSSVAIIGAGTGNSKSTLTFPVSGSSPTTITIDNNGSQHTLTLGPSGITITVPLPSYVIATASSVITIQTLSMSLLPSVTSISPPPSPATEVVVVGGSLVTAIGRSVVVIYGTTITYTTLSSPLTTVVTEGGEDTIVLDPFAGILITHHNHPYPDASAGASASAAAAAEVTVTTLGGAHADPSATEFAVVGGATITKVGASVVVVDGVSYTVGPSATFTGGKDGTITMITTVLSGGGQTVTIGPEGVVVGTMTIEYPFKGGDEEDGSSTTVIFPGGGPEAAGTATATATADDTSGSGSGSAKDENEDEDAGTSLEVVWRVMMLGLSVAGAVGVFGL